eukprot:scaffold1468_cov71-Cyclotella_meneghiniana.AAC.3
MSSEVSDHRQRIPNRSNLRNTVYEMGTPRYLPDCWSTVDGIVFHQIGVRRVYEEHWMRWDPYIYNKYMPVDGGVTVLLKTQLMEQRLRKGCSYCLTID